MCAPTCDDGHATGDLGQPLAELLAVPLGLGQLDLATQLRHSVSNGVFGAGAVDERRGVLGDDDPTSRPEHLEADLGELEADLRSHDLATGEHGHVFEHRLAAVAEAGRLDRRNGQAATDLVDHEGGERLTVDVLGHDHQRTTGADDLLEQRQQVGDRGDLALVQQEVGRVELSLHALGVGDEVGRDVALVELQALGDLELGRRGRPLLDGDHAVATDRVHGLGDQLTDGAVLSRDRRDVGDLRRVVDWGRQLVRAAARLLPWPARCRA